MGSMSTTEFFCIIILHLSKSLILFAFIPDVAASQFSQPSIDSFHFANLFALRVNPNPFLPF